MTAAAVKLGLLERTSSRTRRRPTWSSWRPTAGSRSRAAASARYLVRHWERVSLVEGESLVYWLRKLVFRGAWLDHRVKEGMLEVAWDDDDADFAYRDPNGGRALLELAPVPSWHELGSSAEDPARARARRDRRVPRGAAVGPTATSASAAGPARLVTVLALVAAPRRVAGAPRTDARSWSRSRLRRDRRLDRLGPLHLPARETCPRSCRPRTGSCTSAASRSPGSQRAGRRLLVGVALVAVLAWGIAGVTVLPRMTSGAARRRAPRGLPVPRPRAGDVRGRVRRRRGTRALRDGTRHVAVGRGRAWHLDHAGQPAVAASPRATSSSTSPRWQLARSRSRAHAPRTTKPRRSRRALCLEPSSIRLIPSERAPIRRPRQASRRPRVRETSVTKPSPARPGAPRAIAGAVRELDEHPRPRDPGLGDEVRDRVVDVRDELVAARGHPRPRLHQKSRASPSSPTAPTWARPELGDRRGRAACAAGSLLEQVRLVDVLDRVRLLAERDGERREPTGPPSNFSTIARSSSRSSASSPRSSTSSSVERRVGDRGRDRRPRAAPGRSRARAAGAGSRCAACRASGARSRPRRRPRSGRRGSAPSGARSRVSSSGS